jgi:hypothetical protein
MLGQRRHRVWPEPASGEARKQAIASPVPFENDLTAPDGFTAAPDGAASSPAPANSPL